MIPSPSVWAGQQTPDLNNEMRFLRGSPDDSVLTLEEDQLMDHEHNIEDPGHTHDYIDYTLYSNGQNFGSSGVFRSNNLIRNSESSVTGIEVSGVTNNYRHGSENRPRNMHVSFIMRVW